MRVQPRVALIALVVALLAAGLAVIIVRAGDGGHSVASRAQSTTSTSSTITIAHEMDHALTDQHFQFGPATDVLDKNDQQEAYTGFTGLLEGDAKLLEALWSGKYLSAKERDQAATEGGDSSVIRRTPPFLLDTLYFPYTTGRAFVISRYRSGGWESVNAAYR